jgi:hypothetical protein
MSIQWRPVVGYEGTYEVSNGGQVRSVDRTITFTDGRVRKYAGKQLSRYQADGYWKVTLKQQDTGNRVHVHVLVAAAFRGPCPDGQEVCHNDGDRGNCRAGNLRYDTHEGNLADCIAHGTRPQGETHYRSTLQPSTVRAIRKAKGTVKKIAARFGISVTSAWNIRNYKRWGHLS